MSELRQPTESQLSRRDALRQLSVVVAGLAAACTPLRVVLHDYPRDFETDPALLDRVLRAFVTTVIPEADPGAPDLVRAFNDPALPFAAYRAFFASDLSRRAAERFGEPAFERLSLERRTAVVTDGLNADATTKRLYTGAVFLTQASYYAGMYDDAAGCPLIGFEGAYRFRGLDAFTHPDPERFLAATATRDGNFV